MSNTKTVMSQAANTLTAPLNVEDVFSTYLYEGNASTQTITNGIDLDGEGGLVWLKARDDTYVHKLMDTDRGPNSQLESNSTSGAGSQTTLLTAFNSNGFSLGSNAQTNASSTDYASWTFRKAPKFFTCLTYTGTGSAQTIAHDLGDTPGTIIIKGTDYVENWIVYHRSLGATKYIQLNATGAASTSSIAWNNTEPTSTEFTVNTFNAVNEFGYNYVAYLFAHNDGDGEFGPDGDADIIKCGTYTGSGTTNQEINLGFEPQWLLVKNIDGNTGSLDWTLFDNMREWANRTSGDNVALYPNTSAAESGIARCFPTAQGFAFHNDQAYSLNFSGNNYIYIAIRRGTKVPESATEVFDIADMSSFVDTHIVGITPDAALLPWRTTSYDDGTNSYPEMFDRLRGKGGLQTSNNRAENTGRTGQWDYMDRFIGVYSTGAWMWKRAPGFFDVVAYTGGVTSNINHNLEVTPEMYIVKCRTDGAANRGWAVYHTGYDTANNYIRLNLSDGLASLGGVWGSGPTATTFGVGNGYSVVNESGQDYIAYLFASLPGISKVGSVSHVQYTDTNVDCGFTSGARFVLLKRTNTTGDWWVFDTTRGIAAGDDQILFLNSTAVEFANDSMSPLASGFTMVGAGNETGDYIFYAIA